MSPNPKIDSSVKKMPLWKRWLTSACLVAQAIVYWPANVYAATPVTPVPDGMSGWTAQLIDGNRNLVNNNASSQVLQLPDSEISNAMFDTFDTKPLVFARHSAREGRGTIQVMRLTKNTYTGAVTMIVDNITPTIMRDWFNTGNTIAVRYNGVNPFMTYYSGATPTEWTNISGAEFRTMMGIAAQHYSTARGYLADMSSRGDFQKWDTCTIRVLGSCLRRQYNQKLDVYVKPVWSVMHPIEVSRGYSTATRLTVTGCGGGAACEISSGLTFTAVGSWSDMVSTETLAATHTKSQSGWTGLAFALAFAALAGIAGPLLFGTQGVFTSLISTLAEGALEFSIAGAYATEAASYLVLNQIGGSSPGDIKGGFFSAPNISSAPVPSTGGIYTAPVVDPAAAEWDLGGTASTVFLSGSLASGIGGISTVYNQVKPAIVISRPNQMDIMRVSKPTRELNFWTPANQL